MLDWDEDRLDRLPDAERARIREGLGKLHRRGRLPRVEGDETFELVRESGRWMVFLNWAGGVRVRFEAAVDPSVPLQVAVSPDAAVLAPGERLRVTVRATNTGDREVTTRVGHRIAPEAQATHLALLQCPLFVPITLAPRETEEFVSEYLLLVDVPADTRALAVTYLFPATPRETGR
jgi:cytochrome c oxidase assembly protein Cox11